MKERTRRIDAETSRESDGGIVPEKQPNKANPEAAEVVEGRPPAKRNTGEEATTRIQSRDRVSYGLEGVRTRANQDKTCCFNVAPRVGAWIETSHPRSVKRDCCEYRHLIPGVLQFSR